jgi:hypothetical protein
MLSIFHAMALKKTDLPSGGAYFVSLETKGRSPVFRDAFFKTKVERRWMMLLTQYPHISADEFVVNDHIFHAMVIMTPDVEHPERQLQELIAQFQAIVLEDWKLGDVLWNPIPKIRRITRKDERDSLRDFIVQKMLGGRDRSLLYDDGDEDDEEYTYDN